MNKLAKLLAFVLLAVVGLNRCTDPTDIGSTLLEDDIIGTHFVDTVSMKLATRLSDTITAYPNDISSATYMLGEYFDPIFGKVDAGVYAQVASPSESFDFESATLDSVVLVIQVDTSYQYGGLVDPYPVDVHQMLLWIDPFDDHYTLEQYDYDATPLASIGINPLVKDSVEVIDYSDYVDPDTLTFPHIRIPMPGVLGQELMMADSATLANDSLLTDYFNGFYFNTPASANGIINLFLGDFRSGLYIYYKDADDTPREVLFPFLSYNVAHFSHLQTDYTGSMVESFIDNETLGDSLMFIQSMQGLAGEIEFPYITDLKGIIVNKAELEFTVAAIAGDDTITYPALEQLLPFSDNLANELLSDTQLNGLGSFPGSLGGNLSEAEDGTMKYTFNISKYVQGAIDGVEDNVIYIYPYQRLLKANRVSIYGTDHPDYAPKLKIYYSN